MEKKYRNIGFYFLSLVIFIALGFYYPYFSLFPAFPAVTFIVHFHTLILLTWVFILIGQPLLVRFGRYKAHRILGKTTYVLMPLVILTCLGVMRQQYAREIRNNISPMASLKSLFTSFTAIASIVIFYALAILNIRKGNVALHLRYMICLFLEFIPPTLGRTLGYWLNMKQTHTHSISILVGAAIIVWLLLSDKRKNENYSPYIVALSLYFIFTASWAVIGYPL